MLASIYVCKSHIPVCVGECALHVSGLHVCPMHIVIIGFSYTTCGVLKLKEKLQTKVD